VFCWLCLFGFLRSLPLYLTLARPRAHTPPPPQTPPPQKNPTKNSRLTDSAGRVVSFKNALVILTSNIGSRVIAGSGRGRGAFGGEGGNAMAPAPRATRLSLAERAARDAAEAGGAARPPKESSSSSGSSGSDEDEQQHESRKQRERQDAAEVEAMRRGAHSSDESDGEAVSDGDGESAGERAAQKARLQELVLDEVKAYFRPELLNRFDQVVVFHRLQVRHVRKIARLLLAETVGRAAARGVALSVGPRLLARAVGEGHSDEYGARPLRQALTHLVDDVLAEAVLSGRVRKGGAAHVELAPAAAAKGGEEAAASSSPRPPAPVAGAPFVYASEAEAEEAHSRAAAAGSRAARRGRAAAQREFVPESASSMRSNNNDYMME